VALEKAGIFRSGVPAMTTATGEALDTLAAEAARLGAAFRAVSPLAGRAHVAGGWAIDLPDGPARLALGGRFQLENAALVLAAIESLNARGWDIPSSAVRQGLAEVSWPGRMERLADPEGGAWLLDAAHNPAAVSALVSGWEPPGVAIFGVQRSKEAAAMVAALSDGVRPLIFVPVPEAESWEPEELAAFAQGPTYAAPDVEAGLALARRLAPTGLRVVTGSIYLVGAARARLLRSL
jgi:dihydrofolate synthase/folylpolyglutamate synthase